MARLSAQMRSILNLAAQHDGDVERWELVGSIYGAEAAGHDGVQTAPAPRMILTGAYTGHTVTLWGVRETFTAGGDDARHRCVQASLSRTLSRMIGTGLLERREGHVEGGGRRRWYHLTDEGFRLARGAAGGYTPTARRPVSTPSTALASHVPVSKPPPSGQTRDRERRGSPSIVPHRSQTRLYEIAQAAGLSNDDVVAAAKACGVAFFNYMSVVSPDDQERILARLCVEAQPIG